MAATFGSVFLWRKGFLNPSKKVRLDLEGLDCLLVGGLSPEGHEYFRLALLGSALGLVVLWLVSVLVLSQSAPVSHSLFTVKKVLAFALFVWRIDLEVGVGPNCGSLVLALRFFSRCTAAGCDKVFRRDGFQRDPNSGADLKRHFN